MTPQLGAALSLVGGAGLLLVGHYAGAGTPPRAGRAAPLGDDARAIATHRRAKVLRGALYLIGALVLLAIAGAPSLALLRPRWPDPAAAGVTALLALVCVPLTHVFARRPAAWRDLPELRVSAWSPAASRASIVGWAVYLFGYEALFRGALLLPLRAAVGLPLAIAVNTALYTLAHVDKAPGQTFGCLLVGPLFAWIVLTDGSIQLMFALHLAIALTAELTAARWRPSPAPPMAQ